MRISSGSVKCATRRRSVRGRPGRWNRRGESAIDESPLSFSAEPRKAIEIRGLVRTQAQIRQGRACKRETETALHFAEGSHDSLARGESFHDCGGRFCRVHLHDVTKENIFTAGDLLRKAAAQSHIDH